MGAWLRPETRGICERSLVAAYGCVRKRCRSSETCFNSVTVTLLFIAQHRPGRAFDQIVVKQYADMQGHGKNSDQQLFRNGGTLTLNTLKN